MRTFTILGAALATALVGCAGQHQPQHRSQLAAADCSGVDTNSALSAVYGQGNVKRVEPNYRQEFRARAIQTRYISGANLYVAAQPGMNEAYLERALTCHAAASNGQGNDPLAAKGVINVDVRAVGPTMRIAITGENRAAGKAIWNNARSLQNGQVSVEQLSAAPAPNAAM